VLQDVRKDLSQALRFLKMFTPPKKYRGEQPLLDSVVNNGKYLIAVDGVMMCFVKSDNSLPDGIFGAELIGKHDEINDVWDITDNNDLLGKTIDYYKVMPTKEPAFMIALDPNRLKAIMSDCAQNMPLKIYIHDDKSPVEINGTLKNDHQFYALLMPMMSSKDKFFRPEKPSEPDNLQATEAQV
jgi:hypothetical protein